MEIILLKSSACLLAFIAFYKVFLERTSNHQFKRFYLLIVVLISIGIPFITFIEYIEPQFILGGVGNSEPNLIDTEVLPVEETTNHLSILLWNIYTVGLLFFSMRFIHNLTQIFIKIKRNPKQKIADFISVLLQDYVVPHTFFNYIFLNKTKFENKEIPREVILHEETHAKQKHSLDILFIEILQVIFWFNPLVYLLKRDIKLNHEFLADQAVIHQGIPLTNYQQLLLEFSSNSSTNQLSNAINYSLIKKRFTIMKTKTSKQSQWLRSLLVLPLLAILIYGFSSTKQIEKNITSKMSTEGIVHSISNPSSEHTARSISIKIFDNDIYEIEGIKATKKTFVTVINQLHQDITPEVRNKIMNIHLNSTKDISNEEVWFIYNALTNYGFYRIVTDGQEVIRGKGNKPFAISETYTQETLQTLNGAPVTSTLQENEHGSVSLITHSDKQQKGATKEQVAEYNKMAKRYNKMINSGDNVIIKLKDLKRLRILHNLMTEKQRKQAEPFPKLVPPPPPPPAEKAPKAPKSEYIKKLPPPPPPVPEDATPEQRKKYEKMITDYKEKKERQNEMYKKRELELKEARAKERVIRGELRENQIKERALKGELREKRMKERKVERESKMVERTAKRETAMKEREARIVRGELSDVPPPPPPKSPLDHVIDMAKKGATFFYEGEKITSDEAIKLLKNDDSLNISSKGSSTNNPVVRISSKPIKINH